MITFVAPKDHSMTVSQNSLEKGKSGWIGEIFRK